MKCGLLEIGLEVTEAISPNLAKERLLRADGHGANVYSPLRVSVHDPVKKTSEILEEILIDQIGNGWCGDSVERNWAEAIAHFIKKKVESSRKLGYSLYGDDRLVIYDNWHAPVLNHQEALPHLRAHLEHTNVWSAFRRIYVVNGRKLLELTQEESIHHLVRRLREV